MGIRQFAASAFALIILLCFYSFFDYLFLMCYTYKVLDYLGSGFVGSKSTFIRTTKSRRTQETAMAASVGTYQPRERVPAQ